MSQRARGILIVDLGAQYAQLIARRVRETGTWSEIHPPSAALAAARAVDVVSASANECGEILSEVLEASVLACEGHPQVLDAMRAALVSWALPSSSWAAPGSSTLATPRSSATW